MLSVFNGRLIPGIIFRPLFLYVEFRCRHLAKELKLDSAGKSTGSKPHRKGKGNKGGKPAKAAEAKKTKSKKGKGTKGTPSKRSKRDKPPSTPAAESVTLPKKARRCKTAWAPTMDSWSILVTSPLIPFWCHNNSKTDGIRWFYFCFPWSMWVNYFWGKLWPCGKPHADYVNWIQFQAQLCMGYVELALAFQCMWITTSQIIWQTFALWKPQVWKPSKKGVNQLESLCFIEKRGQSKQWNPTHESPWLNHTITEFDQRWSKCFVHWSSPNSGCQVHPTKPSSWLGSMAVEQLGSTWGSVLEDGQRIYARYMNI